MVSKKEKASNIKDMFEAFKNITDDKEFIRQWEKENKDQALTIKMFFEFHSIIADLKKHKNMDFETSYKALSYGLRMAYEFNEFKDKMKKEN